MRVEFFMSMVPPTITHQEHKVAVRNGKPVVYLPQELKAAKEKLRAHLAGFAPENPIEAGTAVWLGVKWCFPIKNDHRNGEYMTSKPDTDNLNKMLKDVMTEVGFWHDDAQVVSEHIEKFWAERPGIYIVVYELGR